MNLSADGKLRLAARVAFLAGVGLVAKGAYAQELVAQADTDTNKTETPEKADQAKQLQGVQVTGSRIKQANLTSSSSATLISEKEFKLQGTTNVETLINAIPQAFAAFGSTDSNGATGTATVNLRGLGSAETLVLIDGKRLQPGDPLQTPPSADLNFIPAALVQRVDVLSGGASAVYGSDAVAGVVNFILKRDTEGFHIDSQVSRTDHSDGTTYDTTLIWGNNFSGGRGNVTVYAGYTKQEEVTEAQRTFSAISVRTPASGDRHLASGSATIPGGRLYSYDRYYFNVRNKAAIDAGTVQRQDPYADVNPDGSRTVVGNTGSRFNFAPFNSLQRPDKRYSLGGFANYKINDHAEVYGSAMFLDNRTIAAVAPSGLFFNNASIACNNPLLSAQEVDYLCTQPGLAPTDNATVLVARRTPEIGRRLSDLRHTDYRIVIGTKGDIADGWTYDVSAQRGEVIYQSRQLNYLNLTNARAGLAAIPDANGNAVCPPGSPAGCVPIDIFQGGQIDATQANYLRINGFTQANLIEQVVNGSISNDLGRYGLTSPLAKSGVGLALGVEYRTESLDYRPDIAVSTPDTLGGFGGASPATSGQFQVHEAFGELNVPLVEDAPLVKELKIDGAYRWSNYSLANDVQSWKIGLKYAPVDDISFRASFQKATRAPSVSELFSPTQFGLAGASDPCAGPNLAASGLTFEQCARSGVTAAQYAAGLAYTPDNPSGIPDCRAGQCNARFGGNTALQAEDSKTWSAGFVFTPTFIPRLTITVDYFHILIDGVIANTPLVSVLNNCIVGNDPAACAAIHRGPTGGLSGGNEGVAFVDTPLINAAKLRTRGVDFETNYLISARDLGLPSNIGRFQLNYVGTLLADLQQENGLGLGVYDCAGLYGVVCGTPNPSYRHKLRATWDITPIGLTLSANWRYIGAVYLDSNTPDTNLGSNGLNNRIDGRIGAKQYLDLSGSYILPTKDRNISLRFGVSNIAGQNPPIVSSNDPNPISSPPFGNGNTFPAVYDSLGRVLFVGLSADF